jgi:hypothetical protein
MRLLTTGLIVLLTSCALATHADSSACAKGDRAFSEDDVSQSSISVNRGSLSGASLLLQVDAPQSANLNGTVKINGKLVANLGTTRSISLASCVASSGCEIDVAATYQPDSAISMAIYSTNGALRSEQQSTGSGVMKQKFVLNVR